MNVPFNLSYFDVDVVLPPTPCRDNDWASTQHQLSSLQSVAVDNLFQPEDDPSDIVHILNFAKSTPHELTSQTAPLYFTLLDKHQTSCFSATTSHPPLIVDTGASVCISPNKSDFITYTSSTMRIKDLLSSNKVAGEGMLSWHVVDNNGKQVTLTLPGFHIPTAEVRLLSPQLLLLQSGGYSHQTHNKIPLHLGSGETMDAHYCQRTRLPMLRMLDDHVTHSFWTSMFDFKRHDALVYPTPM